MEDSSTQLRTLSNGKTVCTGHLIIEMEDDVDYEDGPGPEIRIEPEVFGDSSFARFWYTVDVVRRRQIDQEEEIVDVRSKVQSSVLHFKLSYAKIDEDYVDLIEKMSEKGINFGDTIRSFEAIERKMEDGTNVSPKKDEILQ